ncbi:TPA: hypothetical protein DDW35_08315 [Candidatus Sumerlaeota bacterium]|jgi:uncharacterized RDD family membrane protein YckC|nr:hypothetical protein [Candidatus Sumerlaeota bacterium]
MQTNWFYAQSGKEKGPVDDEAFFALIREGVIAADTQVWRKGMAYWQPLTEAVRGDEAYESPVQECLEIALSLAAVATVQDAVQVASSAPHGKRVIPCSMCGKPGPVVELNFPEGGSWLCADCQQNALQGLKNVLTQQQQQLALAGFLPRVAAFFLDCILLSILLWGLSPVLNIPLPDIEKMLRLQPEQMSKYVNSFQSTYILLAMITFIYRALLIGFWNATLGMRLLRLRVIRQDGAPAGIQGGLIRAFGAYISDEFLGIGYLIALFDSERRTLQDHVAKTRVVRIPPNSSQKPE